MSDTLKSFTATVRQAILADYERLSTDGPTYTCDAVMAIIEAERSKCRELLTQASAILREEANTNSTIETLANEIDTFIQTKKETNQ